MMWRSSTPTMFSSKMKSVAYCPVASFLRWTRTYFTFISIPLLHPYPALARSQQVVHPGLAQWHQYPEASCHPAWHLCLPGLSISGQLRGQRQ
nr:MAG TPA: hypothetical protein [Caudoviricetes sp.]